MDSFKNLTNENKNPSGENSYLSTVISKRKLVFIAKQFRNGRPYRCIYIIHKYTVDRQLCRSRPSRRKAPHERAPKGSLHLFLGIFLHAFTWKDPSEAVNTPSESFQGVFSWDTSVTSVVEFCGRESTGSRF